MSNPNFFREYAHSQYLEKRAEINFGNQLWVHVLQRPVKEWLYTHGWEYSDLNKLSKGFIKKISESFVKMLIDHVYIEGSSVELEFKKGAVNLWTEC